MNLILVSINATEKEKAIHIYVGRYPPLSLPNSHSFLYVSWSHFIAQLHNELGKLLHIDYVSRLVRIPIDDFRASSHLKWLLRLQRRFIGLEIP